MHRSGGVRGWRGRRAAVAAAARLNRSHDGARSLRPAKLDAPCSSSVRFRSLGFPVCSLSVPLCSVCPKTPKQLISARVVVLGGGGWWWCEGRHAHGSLLDRPKSRFGRNQT